MPRFRLIKSKARIEAAEDLLRKRITTASKTPMVRSLGFQGGMEDHEVWWVPDSDFWFASAKAESRWWNSFGLGKPASDNLSIVVEVNPPISGKDRRMGGAFLADSDGTIYLAHTGKVGGGRKGIGKRQFLAYFKGKTIELDGATYILIGAVKEEGFLDKLGAFIRTVDRFKKEATGQQASSATNKTQEPKSAEPPSYWKIAAETQAREWPAWHKGSYIAIGWNELGDLSNVERDEFEQRATAVLKLNPSWKRARLVQVWRFCQIPVGARVVINRGTSRVLAIGTVTGNYHFVKGVELGHRLPVRWDDVEERVVDRGGWRKTLIQLKRADFEEIVRAPRVEDVEEDEEDEEDAIEAEPEEKLDFDGLTAHLGHLGLRFSDETVASYLLALQTKRFVILSGISGTGKTKLAQVIASILSSPDAPTANLRPDVTRVEVMPYMLKYRRIVLPTSLRDELLALDAIKDDEIHVYYGERDNENETKLRLWSNGRSFQVLFRKEFRAWFSKEFEAGDPLDLSIYTDDNDDSISLVFNGVGEEESPEAASPVEGYKIIAVRPDWCDNRGLLGFFNPITEQYRTTPFLDLLLSASAEAKRAAEQERPAEPYFVILDEMNLARVEHYFSDFLSSMESGEPLHLHNDTNLEEGLGDSGQLIPRELVIPRNVFFTGTINVDETTYMFSPKVLDRAFVLEFNRVELETYGVEPEDEDLNESDTLRLENFDGRLGLRHKPGTTPRGIQKTDPLNPGPRDWQELRTIEDGEFTKCLAQLNELLTADNRHFGYRVANEVARFMLLAAEQAGREHEVLWAAFDVALLAKVMPKLHGTEQELRELLERLLGFAIAGEPAARETEDNWNVSGGQLTSKLNKDDRDIWLPRTGAKCWRMLRRLRLQGFVSFIE